MVSPVVGPTTTITYHKGPTTPLGFRPDWGRQARTKYKQARPFTLPLTYQSNDRRILSFTCGTANLNRYVQYTDALDVVTAQAYTWAYNRAYAELQESLGPAAELAVSLAERRQAMDMMSRRLSQMARFTGYLAKRQWYNAADALGLTRAQLRGMNLRRGAKDTANNYLEFHFGWSPLVQDIYAATQVLQKPVPDIRVLGKGRYVVKQTVVKNPGAFWTYDWLGPGSVSYRLQVEIGVTNPNLWLANRMGIVNPAKVLFELVPYSFVLDWFVNVSDFLGGFTDFWGLTVKNPQFSRRVRCTNRRLEYDGHAFAGEIRYFDRVVGPLTGPILSLRKPWQLSPRRGAAAASLLVQRMKSIPH